jgi:hypothetical protein
MMLRRPLRAARPPGVLLGLGLALVLASSSAQAAPAGPTRTFTVLASSSEWLYTGVDLPTGASATLSATGNGTCHAGGASDCPVGVPNGAGYTCAGSPFGSFRSGPAGPAFPYGALAAKVGPDGTPFLLGSGTTAGGPGEVYLVFNDCNPPEGYSDNSGAYTVTVVGGAMPTPNDSPPAGFLPGPRLDLFTYKKHFSPAPDSSKICFLSGACYIESGALVTICNRQDFSERLFSLARPNKFKSATLKTGQCFKKRFVNPGTEPVVVKIYSELHSKMRFLLWIAPR